MRWNATRSCSASATRTRCIARTSAIERGATSAHRLVHAVEVRVQGAADATQDGDLAPGLLGAAELLLGAQEVSLGDFVLSGGELAAMALIDACVRLVPGVVGAPESLADESFERGLLEYPHYTRPRVWRDREVPAVLLSGDHAGIRAWRTREAERLTRERRPDLWRRHEAAAAGT